MGTRASIVPLSFFSTRLYTRFYTRILIYVRFRVYILKERVPASCTNFLRIDLTYSIVLHEQFDFLCM